MSDIVNEHFQRFYPKEINRREDFRYSSDLGGMWEWIKDRNISTIFPAIECVDGFNMSVQGHYGAYSRPRDDFAEQYRLVEVGYPSSPEPLLALYGGSDGEIYGYVPIEVIAQIVAKHGGLK